MSDRVYLNGKFIDKEKAAISPDDRGFYFADGVYEVIRCFKGNFFCFEEHISRLKSSLSKIRISYNGIDKLSSICKELIVNNNLENKYANVYLQITRGVSKRTHNFPGKDISPTIYIIANEKPPNKDKSKKGIKAITQPDIRWLRCDIKSIALLPNTLLFQEAIEKNAGECIFIRDGVITEASHSNVMGVKTGVLFTHPDNNLILPGITKRFVFQICNDLGIYVKETPIGKEDIYSFDELFIMSTGDDITPVIQLDDAVINNGKPGPITRQIQREFFNITYKKLAGEKNLWF